jgi:protein TonB
VAYSYSFDDPARNQKRTLAFVLVILIHAGFLWVLSSGLGSQIVEVIRGPVNVKMIDKPKEEENEPPPPPPDIEAPPPYVPPPDFAIESAPVASNTTAISNTTSTIPAAPPPKAAAPQATSRTPPNTSGKGARVTQPEYPPASRRAGEEGTVTLEIYVLETGKVQEARVKKSSGFPKLDDAAVKEATRSWKLVPGKEDGKPVAMWHTLNVTFRLTE